MDADAVWIRGMPTERYSPFSKDVVCQHQTLYPGAGIEVAGTGMAVGYMAIPLTERYASFVSRLGAALSRPTPGSKEKS